MSSQLPEIHESLSRKGKLAYYKLIENGKRIKVTESTLEEIRVIFKEIINAPDIIDVHTHFFSNNLKRIWYEWNKIIFFIDFAVTTDGNEVLGSFIYGTVKSYLENETIYGTVTKRGKVEITCRIEEKRLAAFSVSPKRVITSNFFDDEWYLREQPHSDANKDNKAIKDNKVTIAEIHFRTLEKIWVETVNWLNEKVIP